MSENVTWARTSDVDGVSAHIVKEHAPSGQPIAVCGRWLRTGTETDNRPSGKTCETCLRIAGPR